MAKLRQKRPEVTARLRAEAIMKVRCGLLSASQAATTLGVSRKTYYKWEERGLSSLLEGLSGKSSGRPRQAVSERESLLEKQVAELRRENGLLQQRIALKELLLALNDRAGSDRGGKK